MVLGDESILEKNNRFRIKIDLPPLVYPGTILQLGTIFIGGLSSELIIDNTAEIKFEDNEMTCERRLKQDPKEEEFLRRKINEVFYCSC